MKLFLKMYNMKNMNSENKTNIRASHHFKNKIFALLILLIISVFLDQYFTPAVPTPTQQKIIDDYRSRHPNSTLKPITAFRTDGCSLFPDSFFKINWQDACIKHDFAYWNGGDDEERKKADTILRNEVNGVIPKLGDVMWFGVKIGGNQELPLPWKWGYGKTE